MKNALSLMKYVKKYYIHAIFAVVFLFAQSFISLYIPRLMTVIIDKAIPNGDSKLLVYTALLMIGLAIIGFFAGIFNVYCAKRVAIYSSADLREYVYRKIQKLSFRNVDKFKTGRLITTSTNDIQQIKMFYSMLFSMILSGPLMLFGGLIVAYQTSKELFPVFLVILPMLALGIIIIMRKAIPLFTQTQKEMDGINSVVLENINSVREIKSFVNTELENKKFTKQNNDYRKVATAANKLLAYAMPMINIIASLAISGMLLLAAYLIKNGSLITDGIPEAGVIMAYFTYTQQILMGLIMLAMSLLFITRAEVSAKRINELLNEEVDLVNKEDSIKDFTLDGSVEFKNVSFGYEKNKNNILNNISFKVNKGETVGIIGSTGAGKSTLVNLIPRLYDTTEGNVLLSGYDVKDLDINQLRDQVAFTTQKPIIFSGTIESNIKMGKLDAKVEDLLSASTAAQAYEFIENKEGKFDEKVEQKGANFSGGQKQRMSLARALIKNSGILILDDTTSAVDAHSEELILKAINEKNKEMTTFIISQKISTIVDADKIIVLDNYGNLDGFGTHKELLDTSKVYQEIHSSQLGGFINE